MLQDISVEEGSALDSKQHLLSQLRERWKNKLDAIDSWWLEVLGPNSLESIIDSASGLSRGRESICIDDRLARVLVHEENTSSHRRLLETPIMHDMEIRQLAEKQVKGLLA